MLCDKKNQKGESCGNCKRCEELEAYTPWDYIWVGIILLPFFLSFVSLFQNQGKILK